MKATYENRSAARGVHMRIPSLINAKPQMWPQHQKKISATRIKTRQNAQALRGPFSLTAPPVMLTLTSFSQHPVKQPVGKLSLFAPFSDSRITLSPDS
jgi:hypothetical protein